MHQLAHQSPKEKGRSRSDADDKSHYEKRATIVPANSEQDGYSDTGESNGNKSETNSYRRRKRGPLKFGASLVKASMFEKVVLFLRGSH